MVAGHGVGVVTALMAAIDGGATLSGPGGLWLSPRARQYYRWRWPLRLAAQLSVLLAVAFAIPFMLLAAGAVLYAGGFLLTLVGVDAGSSLVTWVSSRTADAFAGPHLPTQVPRIVMIVVLGIALVLAGGLLSTRPQRAGMARASRGRWWWRLLSSPFDAEPLRAAVVRSMWERVRGAAAAARPSNAALSRRYAEVLAENLGQPGCRELMLAVTDLDARRDIVGALLAGPFEEPFFASQPGRERGAEVVNLASSGRDMIVNLLGAALTPSIGTEAYPIEFPPDGYWRGETHRGCDRPGILSRLLSELEAAQVAQVLVVSAAAPPAPPHRLRPPSIEPRERLGEYFAASESAALEDAVSAARARFGALYVICPTHNPVGPFDLDGAYDEGSDRRHPLGELEQHGYHDAYQQFIDPVVGASGEQLAPAMTE